ncbi:MAG TPA: hypothetical protein VMF07_16725 [Solirubrobacteraceae bacterium]|nr:hypothetical protein [Solirubrobacteraceae bacterium]
MKLALGRLLSTTALITVTAIVIALIVRHAKHGPAVYLGDIAWFTFLIGALLTAGLAIGLIIARAVNSRHANSSLR